MTGSWQANWWMYDYCHSDAFYTDNYIYYGLFHTWKVVQDRGSTSSSYMWSNLAVESLRSKPGKAQCVGRLYQMDISSGVIPHSTGPRPGMIEIKYCDFSFSLFFFFFFFFFFWKRRSSLVITSNWRHGWPSTFKFPYYFPNITVGFIMIGSGNEGVTLASLRTMARSGIHGCSWDKEWPLLRLSESRKWKFASYATMYFWKTTRSAAQLAVLCDLFTDQPWR